MDRLSEFCAYHWAMEDMGDIDPSYPLLRYVCDRFELTLEQRYWLAYLYSLTYCGASVYYIYNEFPDFENVDLSRLERWWAAHKSQIVFQTDRRWLRSRNQFVPAVASYRQWVGSGTQEARFARLRQNTPERTYERAYREAGTIFQMGRFALFLYLEAVYVITRFPMQPHGLDWANALSSRNGLLFALGMDDLLRGHDYGDEPLPRMVFAALDDELDALLNRLKDERPETRVDVWNVETTLCAYKKAKRGKRYPGYYLDRQGHEIHQMEAAVTEGVHWGVLWDFRRETFDLNVLEECGADNRHRWETGLRQDYVVESALEDA